MTKYLYEFSCLSMHRCVRTGHTEICNSLHTHSAYEIRQNLSGLAILLFSEFFTPGCHNLMREQTVLCMTGQVILTNLPLDLGSCHKQGHWLDCSEQMV